MTASDTPMTPQVGQLVTGYYFGPARIIAVREFGTIDVQAADGRCFRVSGLPLVQS